MDLGNLALQFQSLLNHLHFNSCFSYFNNIFAISTDEHERNKKGNFYFTYAILAWTLLYIIFKVYLNVFLRQQNYTLIQRTRIINSLWSWSFHLIALFYVQFYHLSNAPFAFKTSETLYPIYLAMKSFCIHFVGVNIFSNATLMTGFTYLLFTLFVFSDLDKCFNPYILYVFSIKVVDILILETCRFLFILWKDNCGNVFSKFLFIIHCVYWIYMYFYFIPNFLLSSEKEIDLSRIPYFYLWYISECIDSVWIKLFKYNRTEPWLKTYLFMSTEESTQLMIIYKKHEDGSYKKNARALRLKKQLLLWKTVKCAIALKKTLHRRRKAQKEQKELQEVGVIEKVSNTTHKL